MFASGFLNASGTHQQSLFKPGSLGSEAMARSLDSTRMTFPSTNGSHRPKAIEAIAPEPTTRTVMPRITGRRVQQGARTGRTGGEELVHAKLHALRRIYWTCLPQEGTSIPLHDKWGRNGTPAPMIAHPSYPRRRHRWTMRDYHMMVSFRVPFQGKTRVHTIKKDLYDCQEKAQHPTSQPRN